MLKLPNSKGFSIQRLTLLPADNFVIRTSSLTPPCGRSLKQIEITHPRPDPNEIEGLTDPYQVVAGDKSITVNNLAGDKSAAVNNPNRRSVQVFPDYQPYYQEPY